MATILVLGASGMLGSIVDLYFRKKTSHEVLSTQRGGSLPAERRFSFDATEDPSSLSRVFEMAAHVDYVINCIGIIKPHCKDDDPRGVLRAIKVNALFPYRLEETCREKGTRLIQIATDCVFSGRLGGYSEDSLHDPLDVYGKTKSLGELKTGACLNLRCSIIGPERKGKLSLLEWVLAQPENARLKGFTHHRWNGATTLQFAEMCADIIAEGSFDRLVAQSRLYHCVLNQTVTKCDLVRAIASAYGMHVVVDPVDSIGEPIDRTLSSKFPWKYARPDGTIHAALERLRAFAQDFGYECA